MKDGAMDYEEILSKYSNKSLDTSSLEKKLEVARPLDARPNELDFWTTGITFNTIREGINAQTIIEKPEKVSEYRETVDNILKEYYENLISRINRTKAWGIMKETPSKITIDEFNVLDTDEKLRLVMLLNKKFHKYLKVQQYADLRKELIGDEDLSEDNVQKLQFIMQMFNGLRSKEIKDDFFCISKDMIVALINFKKSKYKKLEEYMSSRNKTLRQEYLNYSKFYSTEDFRDITENLQLTSRALKVSINRIITYYSTISRINFEIRGLEEEYAVFESLQEKNKKMMLVERKDKKTIEQKMEEPVIKKISQAEENIKKIEINTKVKTKEQINPLIFAWFGREDKEFSEFVDAKEFSMFLEKIKKVEMETKTRVGLYIVTNANKDVSQSRMQELQQKAKIKGLPRLVEGVLGGYSSFRIEKDGKITDLYTMSEETRESLSKLFEKSIDSSFFTNEHIDPRENNYIRYIFSIKKNDNIDFKYLSSIISKLLKDSDIKKQPISFVPFIEGEISGVDVLLKSQLEGINKVSEYIKSKYYIAPGKTLKANINAISQFLEEK